MPTRKQKSKKKASKQPRSTVVANNVAPRPIASKRLVQRKRTSAPAHVSRVCSVTDPFCPAAKNSKWPDGTSGNTLTMQFRKLYPLTVNANGNGVVAFAAAAPYGSIGATTVGSVATFDSAYTALQATSMLETYGSTYRIVSYGCIVRCVASATTASGTVTLGTAPAPTPASTLNVGEELYQDIAVAAIQPGMEISWISTPKGTGARDFIAQSTATTNYSTDWSSLYLEITGATANSTCLAVELFMNVEFLPAATARNLAVLARPNPPKSSIAESAVSATHSSVGSFIQGGVQAAEDVVVKHAKAALDSFLSDPLTSLAGLFI